MDLRVLKLNKSYPSCLVPRKRIEIHFSNGFRRMLLYWVWWDGVFLPTAALTVPCFASVARKVMITHQVFLATAEQCWHSINSVCQCSLHSPVGWGLGKILWGDIARTADLKWSKGCTRQYSVCSDIKSKRKEEEGKAFIIYDVYLPEQALCVLKPCFLASGWTPDADGK